MEARVSARLIKEDGSSKDFSVAVYRRQGVTNIPEVFEGASYFNQKNLLVGFEGECLVSTNTNEKSPVTRLIQLPVGQTAEVPLKLLKDLKPVESLAFSAFWDSDQLGFNIDLKNFKKRATIRSLELKQGTQQLIMKNDQKIIGLFSSPLIEMSSLSRESSIELNFVVMVKKNQTMTVSCSLMPVDWL